MGGLGNQLFQYAVARHLAELHRTALKIDISLYKSYELHAYSIWPFNIQENFASSEEVMALTVRRQGIAKRVIRCVVRKPPELFPTYVSEKHFHFDPDILRLPDNVYLDGYWQSEKYFVDIAEIIRNEFTVKTSQDGKDKELAELIRRSESTSLHIRRGSYLLPEYNATHGTSSLEYYFRCVECLTQTVRKPHFYVFSDDPSWVRDHLDLPYPTTFVDHNKADRDYEDLRLMSQCKHHIIANSTFSWWGAWLCNNPDKMVFAPEKWFNAPAADTKDLIPGDWYKI